MPAHRRVRSRWRVVKLVRDLIAGRSAALTEQPSVKRSISAYLRRQSIHDATETALWQADDSRQGAISQIRLPLGLRVLRPGPRSDGDSPHRVGTPSRRGSPSHERVSQAESSLRLAELSRSLVGRARTHELVRDEERSDEEPCAAERAQTMRRLTFAAHAAELSPSVDPGSQQTSGSRYERAAHYPRV